MSLEKLQESNILDEFKGPIKNLKSSIKSGNVFWNNLKEIPASLKVNNPHSNNLIIPIKTEISGYSIEEKLWKAPGSSRERKDYLNLYLNINRKLSNENYNKMFKWLNEVRQWKIWNCYFITSIKNIARSDFFDILMKTSIESRWNWYYYIYMPLWEPKWEKIAIAPQDLKVAKIQWAIWYKILEVWFAKYLLNKKGIISNTNLPLTEDAIKKIAKWKSWDSMQTILWPKNFNIQTILWPKDFDINTNNSKNRIRSIMEALKNFDPKNLWVISVSSRQNKEKTDTQSYKVHWQTMYYNHSYSLYAVEKVWNRVVSVVLENPRNTKNRKWGKKIRLPIFSFLTAIHSMYVGKPTQNFLNFTTSPEDIKIVDNVNR